MTKKLGILMLGLVAATTLVVMTVRSDRSLAKLQGAGVIRVGYAVEAPYVYLQPGGEVTGAEAELTRVIAARLGIQRLEWRLAEFNQLISELEAGQVDVIVAGMYITPERAKRASFSEPTFYVQPGLLVLNGNPRQLHSYAQVAMIPGVKIAVLSGSIEASLLKQLGVSEAQLVPVPDALTGRTAVETGLADGLALSTLSIRWMALQDPLMRTEMAQPFEPDEYYRQQRLGYGAVVFRQADRQLRQAWNAALQAFLGTPEHLSLVAPFGLTAAELPGAITTQEILSQP